MRIIFFDCESLHLSDEDGYSWSRPWQMGLAVCATTEKGDEARQWLAEDAPELVNYLGTADAIVGFNCLRFDLPLVGGEVRHQIEGDYKEDAGDLAQSLDDSIFLIDMLLDVWVSLGKRMKGTGLKPLAVHTLGKEVGMEGDHAPVAWADHRKLEVIQYCADDVEWSRELFNHGLKHGWLNRPRYADRPLNANNPCIKFPITWNIRNAAGDVVEPFRDWYDRQTEGKDSDNG